MSLKRERERIRAELAQLEGAEIRARRAYAFSAASRELQERELDLIVAERKRLQTLLARQVNDELND